MTGSPGETWGLPGGADRALKHDIAPDPCFLRGKGAVAVTTGGVFI